MQLFCTPSGRYDDPQEVYPRYAGFKYPVAGADNSRITFNVWKEGDAATHPVVLPIDGETYLPAINVIPRTGEWVVTALNRLQNHIRLLAVDIEQETARLLYEDTSDTYINEEDITSAVFYPDCFSQFSQDQRIVKRIPASQPQRSVFLFPFIN